MISLSFSPSLFFYTLHISRHFFYIKCSLPFFVIYLFFYMCFSFLRHILQIKKYISHFFCFTIAISHSHFSSTLLFHIDHFHLATCAFLTLTSAVLSMITFPNSLFLILSCHLSLCLPVLMSSLPIAVTLPTCINELTTDPRHFVYLD